MKILCVQLRRLGDVLMCTPALAALKQSLPGCRITFLVEKSCAVAIAGNPNADEILCPEDFSFFGLIKTLRARRFDAALDFMGTPATARLLFFSGAKKRIGFMQRGRGLFYSCRIPRPAERTYSAQAKAALLAPLSASCASWMPQFFETKEEIREAERLVRQFRLDQRNDVAALSPVSRRGYKRWPLLRFAQTCEMLHERRGLFFLPLFGPGEESFVLEMIGHSRKKEIFLFPYEPFSFGALKPLLKRCRIYFGNDNGIRHMAIIAGIPTAAIFGRPDPLNWTPPGSSRDFHVWGREDMASVSPEAGLEIAEKALECANHEKN